jgi:hypothetical protein
MSRIEVIRPGGREERGSQESGVGSREYRVKSQEFGVLSVIQIKVIGLFSKTIKLIQFGIEITVRNCYVYPFVI